MKMFKSKLYPFPALFADGGGESGDEGKKKDDPPKDDPPPKDEGDKKKDEPFASFPTESALMARINQGADSKLKKVAEELGFESVETMQQAAKTAKEAEEKNKTELEKEKARADKLEQERQDNVEKANQKLVNAELKVFAAQLKFVDPQDAVALANRSEIQVDEEGNVTGAEDAVKALAKAKPHLTGKAGSQAGGGSFNSGSDGAGGLSEEEEGKKLAEEYAKRQQVSIGKGVLNPWSE